jgi:hypothetical protein
LTDSGDIFLISLIGFLIGLLLMVTGFWRYLVVQKLRNTPLSKVSSAAVGRVALSGKARLGEPLVSPISEIPCAFWRIYASCHRSNGHRDELEGIHNDQSKNLIIFEDETGRIPVVTEGADIDIPSNLSFEGYIHERGMVLKEPADMDPRVLKFIESQEPATQDIYHRHREEKILINEYIIRDNDPLFILGSVMPADGVLGVPGQETLVIRQSPNDSTMYICDSTERDFVKKMTGHMYLQIIAGLALSGVCLYLLLSAGGN